MRWFLRWPREPAEAECRLQRQNWLGACPARFRGPRTCPHRPQHVRSRFAAPVAARDHPTGAQGQCTRCRRVPQGRSSPSGA